MTWRRLLDPKPLDPWLPRWFQGVWYVGFILFDWLRLKVVDRDPRGDRE